MTDRSDLHSADRRRNPSLWGGHRPSTPVSRAAHLPALEITLNGVPTKANPLGVKGAGQAGAMAAPQAIICAVLDALAPLGVTHIDMPATPERVWRAIRVARPA